MVNCDGPYVTFSYILMRASEVGAVTRHGVRDPLVHSHLIRLFTKTVSLARHNIYL